MNELDKLYEIPADQQEAIEEMITPTEDVEAVRTIPTTSFFHPESLAKRLLYYEARLRGLEAEYRPIIEAMETSINFLKKKKENIVLLLQTVVPNGTEFINEQVDIRSTPSTEVEITDLSQIPLEYLRVKEPEADKTLIKQAWRAGREIPGATPKVNYSIKVKPGGIKAIENAKKRAKKKLAQNAGQDFACYPDASDLE